MTTSQFIKRAVVKQDADGQWVLWTKDMSRVLGRHPTPSAAYGQEYAIQKSQEGSKVQQLLEAKGHSDKGLYRKKHEILRRLMSKSPEEFYSDSQARGMHGITHRPSGFRVHMPRREFPPNFKPRHSDIENQDKK
jgi:hypothetical protein